MRLLFIGSPGGLWLPPGDPSQRIGGKGERLIHFWVFRLEGVGVGYQEGGRLCGIGIKRSESPAIDLNNTCRIKPMPRKRNRKNRSRKDIGFDAAAKKSKKDSITGLSVQLDEYGTIESDQTYGPGSELMKRVYQSLEFPIEGDLWYEFEMGKDKIVFTSRFVGNEDSFTDESYQRGVVTGEFDYANGKLASAEIDGISAHNIDFKDGGKYYEQSYIERFPQARKVGNIRKTPPWEYALREEGAQVIMFAQWSTGNIFNTNEGNVADIYGHLGGRIFEPGWWSNPFEPNLV